MNKEIKFRVFSNGIMYYPDLITFGCKRINKTSDGWDDTVMFKMNEDPNWFYEKIENVQQFIGLKDKNQKEIYEGDIIKAVGSLGRGYISEVECDYSTLYGLSLHGYHLGVEVIGNIFENPELIRE